MEQNKVDSLIYMFGSKIPRERLGEVIDLLKRAPDEKFTVLAGIQMNDPTIITVISAVIGTLGVDRFMLGDIGLGVLKLLTIGVCGIMWFIDIFLVGKRAEELNYRRIVSLL